MKKEVTFADYENIPFAYRGDSDMMSKQVPHRLRVTQRFIGKDIAGLKTLDIGASNMFGRLLGLKDNTGMVDLNHDFSAPSKNYDLVGCFEIIEHVMNPLNLLLNIHKVLKHEGYCYLSTPRPFFGFLQGRQHFTEYKPDRMERMMVFAGFKVIRRKKFCIWDWDFFFYGFRPAFRVLFHRNYIWELRK